MCSLHLPPIPEPTSYTYPLHLNPTPSACRRRVCVRQSPPSPSNHTLYTTLKPYTLDPPPLNHHPWEGESMCLKYEPSSESVLRRHASDRVHLSLLPLLSRNLNNRPHSRPSPSSLSLLSGSLQILASFALALSQPYRMQETCVCAAKFTVKAGKCQACSTCAIGLLETYSPHLNKLPTPIHYA